jgi:hypothetical protein
VPICEPHYSELSPLDFRTTTEERPVWLFFPKV